MRYPDHLPNYVRGRFGKEEPSAEEMLKEAREDADKGRTISMSKFLRRTELSDRHPIPMPLYITSPPEQMKRS